MLLALLAGTAVPNTEKKIQLSASRVVAQCTAPGTGLPPDKPRYVMGIGYPLDIVICSGKHHSNVSSEQ